MQISDLEYIALEGGGGKGGVYKGAIVALEKLFDKACKDGNLAKASGSSKVPTPLLDYYETKPENPRLKGISGSSAGAITAFPLALGLNSTDIEEIMTRFLFEKEFLPNHKLNEGKYRMVGMDRNGGAKILVAEDHLKKLGEDKLLHYEFNLQDRDLIGQNWLKSNVRSAIVASFFSIIFTGLKENWSLVSRFINIIARFINNYNYLKKWSAWLKSNVIQNWSSQIFGNTALSRFLTSLTPVPWNWAIKRILRLRYLNRLPWGTKNQLKLLDVMPADNIVSALGNILWDRGIYAGFEIREFFFKILLKAISSDSHFRRGLLKSSELLESIELNQNELDKLDISFDANYEVKIAAGRGTFVKLARLPEKLTFREFYKITNVNLTICVTNASTSQPLYFSHYFTPDFPVLEAVGASMNFPIAFKPTYNEANVLLYQDTPDQGGKNPVGGRTFLNPADFVRFSPHEADRRFYRESFSMRTYHKHLGIVLSYIKEKSGELSMSVNGNLSFRSFLPYLRKIIEGRNFHSFEVKDHAHNRQERYDSNYMKSLCYFYYNTAFKGLLIDGGATNNLPLSIFTLEPDASGGLQNLAIKKKVLGLKLDNSFPDVLRDEVFEILERDNKTFENLSNWEDKVAYLTFGKRLFKSRRIRKAYERTKAFSNLSEEVWVKVCKELVAEYKDTKGGFTPWNRDLSVIAGLMSSLQFGFDQGQIESIDDNENIIPLYCYGVGTLDFDLGSEEMKPLVRLAVEESEKSVMNYFGNKQPAK